jgi:glycosyltransferase involved in cell wall biosynthesis
MADMSVVVPTYNRASLISATLDAILAQTKRADEIIVVDDGSTDETQAVLARYAGAVTPIRIANSGELVARNTGLRAASGRLVAFCDSDDLWQPEFLATMWAMWQHAPELTAAYSNFRLLRDRGLSASSKFEDAPPGFWTGLREVAPDLAVFDMPIIARLLDFEPFFPSCLVVDRAAFLALGGWDEGVSRIVGCDFATVLRLAAKPPLGIARKALVSIRKHASNFSGDVEAMNLGDARVLEYVLKSRPEVLSLEEAFRHSIARRRQHALASAFSRRDFRAVHEIDSLIPRHMRPAKHRVKVAIAALPAPVGRLIAAALSR